MSLINDALKKAQKQRADEVATPASASRPVPAPVPAAVPPAPASPRTLPPVSVAARPLSPATAATRMPSPARSQEPTLIARAATTPSIRYQAQSPKEPVSTKTLWLCLGAIALVLVSVGITLSLTKTPPEKPVAVTKAASVTPTQKPVATAQDSMPQAEIPLPTPTLSVATFARPTPEPAPVETAPAPAPTVAFTPTPVDQPKAVTPTPAPVAAAQAPATTTAPATVSLPPIYAPRAPTPVNPSIRIQNFIDRLRVTGIRMSTTGSKVILGDRLFNLGDIVDPGLELRLVKVEAGVLTFADANGRTYIKLFQ